MDDESGAGFVTGFFAGAALGAMTALLLAPRSGRELRAEIGAEGERLRGRARDTASEFRGRSDESLEKTRETVREAAEGFREAAEILRKGSGASGA